MNQIYALALIRYGIVLCDINVSGHIALQKATFCRKPARHTRSKEADKTAANIDSRPPLPPSRRSFSLRRCPTLPGEARDRIAKVEAIFSDISGAATARTFKEDETASENQFHSMSSSRPCRIRPLLE